MSLLEQPCQREIPARAGKSTRVLSRLRFLTHFGAYEVKKFAGSNHSIMVSIRDASQTFKKRLDMIAAAAFA